MSMTNDPAFLAAALEGLEAQKRRIEEQIAQIRAMLGKAPAAKPKANRISAEARKRIAAAQVKRWEAFRAKKAE